MEPLNDLTEPERFFAERAGFSFDPAVETAEEGKLRVARALAEAEAWAKDPNNGATFAWERDYEADRDASCDCGEDHGPNYVAALYVGERVAASLGAITFGEGGLSGDPYRRVIEAELAFEAMEESDLVPAEGEEPDMRAHRLAEAIAHTLMADESLGVYNAARNVLIGEFS